MMLGSYITIEDMTWVDTEYYNALKYVLVNDPKDLELNFTFDEEIQEKVKQKELKPNGAKIAVTEENKREWLDLVIKWRFTDRIKLQIDTFLEGFKELVHLERLKVFDEKEIELVMCDTTRADIHN